MHLHVRVREPHLPVEPAGRRIRQHAQGGPAVPARQREDVLACEASDAPAETIGAHPQVIEQVLAALPCDGEEAHHGRALVDDLEAEMPREIRRVDHQQGQRSLEVRRRVVPVRLRGGDDAVDLRQVRLTRPPHSARRRRRPRGVRHRLDICHATARLATGTILIDSERSGALDSPDAPHRSRRLRPGCTADRRHGRARHVPVPAAASGNRAAGLRRLPAPAVRVTAGASGRLHRRHRVEAHQRSRPAIRRSTPVPRSCSA